MHHLFDTQSTPVSSAAASSLSMKIATGMININCPAGFTQTTSVTLTPGKKKPAAAGFNGLLMLSDYRRFLVSASKVATAKYQTFLRSFFSDEIFTT